MKTTERMAIFKLTCLKVGSCVTRDSFVVNRKEVGPLVKGATGEKFQPATGSNRIMHTVRFAKERGGSKFEASRLYNFHSPAFSPPEASA